MSIQQTSHTFTSKPNDLTRLNNWIFDTIQPYIKGRTMEIGSGHGAMASIFVDHSLPIHLSDEYQVNRQLLQERFQGVDAVRMIHDMDFLSNDFERNYRSSLGKFATAVAVNITEHGYYNKIALNNAKHLLRIRGHLIIIAPAYTSLYAGLEEDLEEWKKYNAVMIKKMLGENIEVLKVRYFNWNSTSDAALSAQAGLSTLAVLRKTSD
jgi:hypothetical protein